MSDLPNNNHTTKSKCDLDQPRTARDGNNRVNTTFESWLIEYRKRLREVLEEDTRRTADD